MPNIQRVNWDYVKQIKDPYLLLKTKILWRRSDVKKTGKILIFNPCLIGDFAVSLPAIRTFIKNHPEHKIDLVVTPPLKKLAERLKGVENVFVSKSSTFRKIENVKREKLQNFGDYDLVIVMRISDESYSILKNLNASDIKVPLFELLKYQFLAFLVDSLKGRNSLTRREIDFLVLDERFSNIKSDQIIEVDGSDYSRIKSKFVFMKDKSKKILIHTGGSDWIMRMWQNSRWIDLIKRINSTGKYQFIFVGAQDCEKNYKEISEKLGFKVYNLIGKIDIFDLLVVMNLSDYFIGIDSGPRNIAHLADLRSITLFGVASARIYMPWNKKDIVIDKTNGEGAYQTFFYSKNNFMDRIFVSDVYEAFKKLKT